MDELIERLKNQRLANPPLFVSEKGERPIPLLPPVTLEELDLVESLTGLRLPTLLRRMYLEIGNGGFGPQGGILGITLTGWKDDFGNTALSYYLKIIKPPIYNEAYVGLLPICYYSCAEHIYLDCKSEEGRVVFYPHEYEPETQTLQSWLKTWLDAGGSNFVLMEDFFEEDGSQKW